MAASAPRIAHDVTAVLLTVGEPTLERAAESIRRQNPRPAAVVTVEGVTPFSAALGRAVTHVQTPFFLQVDADMVLDENCLQSLLAAMRPGIGLVAAKLRDPLLGSVPAVKLFRRECWNLAPMQATVAQDSDYYERIAELGWTTVYVLPGGSGGTRHTLGEHLPDYTPGYTFATFLLLGARLFYRGHTDGLHWRIRVLRASRHPMARVARIALAYGLFGDETRELPKSAVARDEQLLARIARARATPRPDLPDAGCAGDAATGCALWYEHGRALAGREDCAGLAGALGALAASPDGWSWAAEAAVGHGFLSAVADEPEAAGIWQRLRRLAPRAR
jgi:hypothetical protein